MIRKFLAPVIANTPLSQPGYHALRLLAPDLVRDARPGQFVAALAGDTGAQILRRPFSIFAVDAGAGEATLLYGAHGPTARVLAERAPGDALDLVGPLGRRVFEIDRRPGTHHVLVGGSYGIPPLVFLARTIRSDDPGAEITFVARGDGFLVGTEGLETIGVTIRRDDALSELAADRTRPVTVYTCGPTGMMRGVAAACVAADVPCQVAMEVFMPCGLGICMGCAVARTDGTFARGCYDGPVFDAREVRW